MVKFIEVVTKRSLMGCLGTEPVGFLKITLGDARSLTRSRIHFERGQVKFGGLFPSGKTVTTYENVAYPLHFLIDRLTVGMNWLEIPAERYTSMPDQHKVPRVQIEVECHFEILVSHAPEGQWFMIASY